MLSLCDAAAVQSSQRGLYTNDRILLRAGHPQFPCVSAADAGQSASQQCFSALIGQDAPCVQQMLWQMLQQKLSLSTTSPPPASTHEDAGRSSSITAAPSFQKIPSRVCQAQRSPNKLRSASSRCRSRASPSRIIGIIICTPLLILDVLLVFPKSSERYKKEQTAAVRSFDGRG